jgi:hypothetical protein
MLNISQLHFPKFTWYNQDKKSDVAGDTGQMKNFNPFRFP